jgi:uncharacterized protein (DUF1499 family)
MTNHEVQMTVRNPAKLLSLGILSLTLAACTATPDVTESNTEASAKADTKPMFWSQDNQEVIALANSLVNEVDIQTAREAVVKLYENAPSAQFDDNKARLQATVDELVYGVLLATVSENIARPKIVWSETLPYDVGDVSIPGSRYAGDTPDRMYRNVVVSSDYRYVLHGKRSDLASLDFSIESIPGPANWGIPPLSIVQAKDIEFASDGSFVITMDATAADGRSNHLQLPPKTQALLIRDTIADWNNHQPNALTMQGLDAASTPDRPRQEIINFSAETLNKAARASLAFFTGIWKRDVNQLTTYVRDLGWGIIGLNRFNIAADEALLVTIDPLSAEYFGLQVDDLWLRSIDYSKHSSTLNTTQAEANAEGTYTFIVAPTDPGYHNWIDTGGLNNGYLVGRWELFKQPTNGEGAVTKVQLLKVAELASAMPTGAKRTNPKQRQQLLQARRHSYELRLGK